MVLALASGDLAGASEWARTVLKPRLEQIDGVARAQVVGAPKPEVRSTPIRRAWRSSASRRANSRMHSRRRT
ncbi:MAG: hypothetical protein U0527_00310 [Candidatus Eisenbacteria bacterium]